MIDLSSISDIHTHRLPAEAGTAIVNLPMEALESGQFEFKEGQFYSAGIHPLYEGEWEQAWINLQNLAEHPQIVAVGECGLDKRAHSPLGRQMQFLDWQMALADQLQKPLIIHCVKAWDELLMIHRQAATPNVHIIHGFRGKPELAAQLLSAGLYLSFGKRYNGASFELCPPDRRFRETDTLE